MANLEGSRRVGAFTVQSLFPDVCWTPLGALMVPVPYDISATFEVAKGYASDVRLRSAGAATTKTHLESCTGDEGGSGGGLISTVNTGSCRAMSFSVTVRAGGGNMIHHLAFMWMNCRDPETGLPNTLGQVIYQVDRQYAEIDQSGGLVLPAAPVPDAPLDPSEPSTDLTERGFWDSVADIGAALQKQAEGAIEQVGIVANDFYDAGAAAAGFVAETMERQFYLGIGRPFFPDEVARIEAEMAAERADAWEIAKGVGSIIWDDPVGSAKIIGWSAFTTIFVDPADYEEAWEKRGAGAVLVQLVVDFPEKAAKIFGKGADAARALKKEKRVAAAGAKAGKGAKKPPEGPKAAPEGGGGKGKKKGSGVRVDLPPARTPEGKKARWKMYQASDRKKHLPYEQWSNVYDENINRASKANKVADDYQKACGWGKREVEVDVPMTAETGFIENRKLDIGDPYSKPPRGVEVKSGHIGLGSEIRFEIDRDAVLVEQGWDISWVFTEKPDDGVIALLGEAGITYVLDPPPW